MQQDEIKRLVNKYRLISIAWLTVFLVFAVFANWFLIESSIERHHELGLDHNLTSTGFIWGTIILGLNIVLHLFFYSLQKILIKVNECVGVN